MTHLPHIAARLFNTPLLIHPSKLQAIVAGLSSRLGVAPPNPLPDAYTVRSGTAAKGGYRVVDGIAVIDVFGALAHRTELQANSSFILGYETIGQMLDNALADRDVAAVVLNIDSPGGEVSGAFQLAEQIRAARSVKPIHAVASDLAASAGYLIASSAQSVSVTPTGQVGSIGVVTCHVDMSAAFEKAGYKVTPIFAGSHKVDGNPYQPLPPAVANQIQTEIDHYYSMFVAAVAAGRPGLPVRAIRATEAAMYIGAQAVEVGLADRVETPDQLIARLATEANALSSPSAVRAAAHLGTNMPVNAEKTQATPVMLSPDSIVQMCSAEPALGRALLGKQLTAEQLKARLADAKEIRAMAKLVHLSDNPAVTAMVNAGVSPDTAGQQLLQLAAEQDAALPVNNTHTGNVVEFGGYGGDHFLKAASDALVVRMGGKVKDPHPAVRDFQDASLSGMAALCLNASGHSTFGRSRAQIIRMAMGSGTTSDFPHLLENVANKSLTSRFEAMVEHRQLCETATLQDFKRASAVNVSFLPGLMEKPEAAEIKYGSLSDGAESYKLATYARGLVLTREAIVNDDLNAFAAITANAANSAARLERDLVFAALIANAAMSDGVALFHANHGNLDTNAHGVDIAGLNAARVLMRKQQDSSGGYVLTDPRFIVCPVALEADAEALTAALTYRPGSNTELQTPAWIKSLAVVSDPRLDAASASVWYLLSNPLVAPTIRLGYLNGATSPVVEQEGDFDTDVMKFKIRFDVCAAAVGWAGGVKMA